MIIKSLKLMMIDDILFFVCWYFKTVNTINDEVNNCAYVNIEIFIVNLSVFFLFTNKKLTKH